MQILLVAIMRACHLLVLSFEIIIAEETSEICKKKSYFFQFMDDLETDNSEDESSNLINKVRRDLHPYHLLPVGDIEGHDKATKKGGVQAQQIIFAFITMKHVIIQIYLKKMCT